MEADNLFHPGIFIKEEITERGLLKKDVAKELGILPSNLSDILRGNRHVSAKLAVKLEKLFNVSAEYWFGLQMSYDLHVARDKEELNPVS